MYSELRTLARKWRFNSAVCTSGNDRTCVLMGSIDGGVGDASRNHEDLSVEG